VVKKALTRGGIPFILMNGIAMLLYFQENYSDAKDTFITSLIIFTIGAASIIYNIERWSLIKQSIIHFFLMLVTIFPILLFSGWFMISTMFDVFLIFIYFVLVGIVLWSSIYVIARIFS